MFKKLAASVALVSVMCMSWAFADEGPKLEIGASTVVSSERVAPSAMVGGEGVFKLTGHSNSSAFGTKEHLGATATLGGAADPNGKQRAAVTGGAEFNMAIDGYKDAQPGDTQLQVRLNMEILNARPYTASQGIYFGGQADWSSGRVALLLPLFAAKYDRVNGTFGLGAMAGMKIIGEQNITEMLKIKAVLEGMVFMSGGSNKSVMTGGGAQASAAVGLEARVAKNVTIDASFIADAMSMKISDRNADGSFAAAQTKTIVPLTGITTATFAF